MSFFNVKKNIFLYLYGLKTAIKIITMKKIIIALICINTFTHINSQTNTEIAGVYINRANESLNKLDVEFAKEHFDKAIKYLDSVDSPFVALLGMKIHFEIQDYKEAKKYAIYYFDLAKNKKSEEYNEMLALSIDITERYELQLEEEKRLEEERIIREKESRKIDSLKTIWILKSEALSIKADSIYKFNANNVAIFKNKNFFGLLNDVGETLLAADEYVDVVYFDGFFIFKNKTNEPTKLYCYNSNAKIGFLITSVSDFNTLSTHFGNVMLPRGNGRLVTYPNNSNEAFVFDLNVRKIINISNEEELFRDLKKAGVIEKYSKDSEVKIGKDWFKFGGHLGGGIHPIYAQEGYNLEGFLCSIDGRFLRTYSDYNFIGAFYNNSAQATKGNQVFWINQNGTKVNETNDETAIYKGNSKLTKLPSGSYQIKRDDLIILGDKKLEKMSDFLRNSSGK